MTWRVGVSLHGLEMAGERAGIRDRAVIAERVRAALEAGRVSAERPRWLERRPKRERGRSTPGTRTASSTSSPPGPNASSCSPFSSATTRLRRDASSPVPHLRDAGLGKPLRRARRPAPDVERATSTRRPRRRAHRPLRLRLPRLRTRPAPGRRPDRRPHPPPFPVRGRRAPPRALPRV